MIDTKSILKEYRKQKTIGDDQVKKKKISESYLDKNLMDGVCTELLRIWLLAGVGRNSAKLKDAKRAKTASRNKEYKRAMLGKLEKHWIEMCPKIRGSNTGYFKQFSLNFNKNLRDIWVS